MDAATLYMIVTLKDGSMRTDAIPHQDPTYCWAHGKYTPKVLECGVSDEEHWPRNSSTCSECREAPMPKLLRDVLIAFAVGGVFGAGRRSVSSREGRSKVFVRAMPQVARSRGHWDVIP